MTSAHPEDPHLIERTTWLRAAVLGGNDGIVSTASVIVGVASAAPGLATVLLSGVAALVAGAMSMAAGEYVSVSSQADLEKSDIARERAELERNPAAEEAELAAIYEERGLSANTARQVAKELTQADALRAHVRDELGLTEQQTTDPFVAAAASGATFCVFAAVPLVAAWLSPPGLLIATVVVVTFAALACLGALGAWAGGARFGPAALRVMLWGGAAMAATAAVGRLFGVAVG